MVKASVLTALPPPQIQPPILLWGTQQQQKSHSERQIENSCLFWGMESDKKGLLHPLSVICDNVQSPWDGHCATSVPQCGSTCGTAGPALPTGNKEGRATNPKATWHCCHFSQVLLRKVLPTPWKRQRWESTEGAARIPAFNFLPTAEPIGPAGKITPLIALPEQTLWFQCLSCPQLPWPLAFPLGESSRKRSSIAPAKGQWPWCGTEPYRQFLALDSRGRKTSTSCKERTLHLNCQNCLPKVQETEKVFVE